MVAEQPLTYEHGTPISEPSIPIQPSPIQPPAVFHVPSLIDAFKDLKVYDDIVFRRSYKRIKHTKKRQRGGIAIEVLVNNKSEFWPLEDFIEDGEFIDELICNMVNDWIYKAEKYPHVRRKCLFCDFKTIKGNVMCGNCKKNYQDTIYNF